MPFPYKSIDGTARRFFRRGRCRCGCIGHLDISQESFGRGVPGLAVERRPPYRRDVKPRVPVCPSILADRKPKLIIPGQHCPERRYYRRSFRLIRDDTVVAITFAQFNRLPIGANSPNDQPVARADDHRVHIGQQIDKHCGHARQNNAQHQDADQFPFEQGRPETMQLRTIIRNLSAFRELLILWIVVGCG